LGQSHDFTAIAVVERVELVGEFDPVVYANEEIIERRLRHLERVPLGTPYTEIVERVGQVVQTRGVRDCCHLVVDATGVGRPVVDMLRSARLPCRLMPTLITGGEQEGSANGYHRVPKRDLITGLRLLLEQGMLKIAAALEHGPTLVNELADMRVKVTAAGNEQYEAWREGTHDDLVLAVALACWGLKKVYPERPRGKEGYCTFPEVLW
jgi:hypothetical protein